MARKPIGKLCTSCKINSSANLFLHPKKIKQIHIKGDTYKVIFVKNLKDLGVTDGGKLTVKIRKGMSNQETLRTLIHEILHVLEFSWPIEQLKHHKHVYPMADGLWQIYIDNFL